MSPASAGGFLTTGPPGKSSVDFNEQTNGCHLLSPALGAVSDSHSIRMPHPALELTAHVETQHTSHSKAGVGGDLHETREPEGLPGRSWPPGSLRLPEPAVSP